MKNLASIIRFSKMFSGYGHWSIKMTIENPNLLLEDGDEYWRFNKKEDEPERLDISHTTTNSRAIDGYDGYEVTLAQECLRANDINEDLFDFSTLRTEIE